jgi:hypothetical protein
VRVRDSEKYQTASAGADNTDRSNGEAGFSMRDAI